MVISHEKYPEDKTPSINAQCWSMPISADQNHGIDPKCLWLPINANLLDLELVGIDLHWSELIDIRINARILISIDPHWSVLGIDLGSPVKIIRRQQALLYSGCTLSKKNPCPLKFFVYLSSKRMHTVYFYLCNWSHSKCSLSLSSTNNYNHVGRVVVTHCFLLNFLCILSVSLTIQWILAKPWNKSWPFPDLSPPAWHLLILSWAVNTMSKYSLTFRPLSQ